MRIHIPVHLEKFEIVSQLKKLLVEYSKGGLTENGVDNFESYFYEQSLDAVRRFLMLCITEDRIGSANYDSLIDYYTSKFFSFRGTLRIFELLDEISDILGVTLDKDHPYEYDVNHLVVNFDRVETFDMNLFTSSVLRFFESLLYFQDYVDTIQTLQLDIVCDLNVALLGGMACYTEYIVGEEVLEDEN